MRYTVPLAQMSLPETGSAAGIAEGVNLTRLPWYTGF